MDTNFLRIKRCALCGCTPYLAKSEMEEDCYSLNCFHEPLDKNGIDFLHPVFWTKWSKMEDVVKEWNNCYGKDFD